MYTPRRSDRFWDRYPPAERGGDGSTEPEGLAATDPLWQVGRNLAVLGLSLESILVLLRGSPE